MRRIKSKEGARLRCGSMALALEWGLRGGEGAAPGPPGRAGPGVAGTSAATNDFERGLRGGAGRYDGKVIHGSDVQSLWAEEQGHVLLLPGVHDSLGLAAAEDRVVCHSGLGLFDPEGGAHL